MNVTNSPWFLKGKVLLLATIAIFVGATTLLPPVSKFEDLSDNLITDSIKLAQSEKEPLPYMTRKDDRISEEAKPYYSQFGLTYHLLLPLRSHLDTARLPMILSVGCAILTALTFWLFSKHLRRTIGPVEGTVFLLLCCLTPTFLFFSGSFYWQLPLLLAPFFITYAFVADRPCQTALMVGVFLFLRFLGGYEYTSTLLLAPICAIMLRLAFQDIRPRPAIFRAIILGGVGFTAFVAALGLHLLTLRLHEGSWSSAINSFSTVVTYRTSGDYFAREISLRNDVILLISSFFRNEVILVMGLALVSCLLTLVWKGRTPAIRISMTLAFSFVAGLSWQVLARGHMRDHGHLNFIVYCIPFALSVYIVFCRLISASGGGANPPPEPAPVQ